MNNKFMDLAFEQAKKAFFNNEVPVGAVIVKNNEIISVGFNRKEELQNCLAHAEIIAINDAQQALNNWRLEGCELYVTLDPCPMCASAIKQARIPTVYSALTNSDEKNSQILRQIFDKDATNPTVEFITDINPQKSKEILNSFFIKQRND